MLPTMTSPTAMRTIAPSSVPRSKLLACLRSSNLDPFGRLGGGPGRRLSRLLLRRDAEVDLEHLAHDRRGNAAAVASMLDQDGERDGRVLHRRIADEPGVVPQGL